MPSDTSNYKDARKQAVSLCVYLSVALEPKIIEDVQRFLEEVYAEGVESVKLNEK